MSDVVFVLQTSLYDSDVIIGVFATLEAAMRAHPGTPTAATQWEATSDSSWIEKDYAGSITRYEVQR